MTLDSAPSLFLDSTDVSQLHRPSLTSSMRSEKRKASSGQRKGKKAKFDVIDTVFDGPGRSTEAASSSQPQAITVRHVDFSETSSGRRRQKTERMQVIPDPREQVRAQTGEAPSDDTAAVDSILAALPVADGEELEHASPVAGGTTRTTRPRSDLRAAVRDRFSASFTVTAVLMSLLRIVFGSGSLTGRTFLTNYSHLKAATRRLRTATFSATCAESGLRLYDAGTVSDDQFAASRVCSRYMPRTCCIGLR